MIAVIFEVAPAENCKAHYLSIAADLKEYLKDIPGFISIERFQSLVDSSKILSLSFWRDEAAIAQWRNLEAHRAAQVKGRKDLFKDYRIRVATVLRDYSMVDGGQAPEDSRDIHR